MRQVLAEISPDGKAILCTFDYDQETKDAVKEVPGARFIGRGANSDHPEPHWRMHLGLETGRNLRERLGSALVLGPNLKRWGKEKVQEEDNLRNLATAKSAKLDRLPDVLPLMWDLINGRPIPGFPEKHALSNVREPRPYQTADIKLMSEANILNGNGMGTGKTIEAIGSVFEADRDEGAHLVVAPVTSHVDPWLEELDRYQPYPIIYGESPDERRDAMKKAKRMSERTEPFWLIIGFHDLRLKRGNPAHLHKGAPWGTDHYKKITYPLICENIELMEIPWASVTIDEAHKSGLSNPKTMFARAAHFLDADKRCAMSGTPMGGKPIRLWGMLHWLDPDEFSSKWRWAETWLDIEENEYGGKDIGDIKKGKIEAFGHAHLRHIVRRTKREALPGLPPKQYIDVWVDMTEKQKEQYKTFEALAEIRIEEEHLSAASILAEYTRLKQLSNAKCKIYTKKIKRRATGIEEILKGLEPTHDCPKLDVLIDRLGENGVRVSEPEPGARAIVASQSKDMIIMVAFWLSKQKLAVDLLTGDTKQGDERNNVINWYKEKTDEPRILAMTTQTGGVSLNLEMTGSVHILDETWNPDDQEQLEDRGDRGSRTTPLICYYYRTRDSIQEAIYGRSLGKRITNRNILDFRTSRIDGNQELHERMEALRAGAR
jgi:SNF2 family DNA or RNA helicase